MRRIGRLVLLFAIAVIACGAMTVGPSFTTFPLTDTPSQKLFDDAERWSRREHLETGGCFSIFAAGQHPVITDATESVKWRRPMKVQLNCAPTDGIWHTHWLAESDSSVGCNVGNSRDLWLIGPSHPLGIVVCGIGRDSAITYTYDPSGQPATATDSFTLIRMQADSFYRCVDEPPVSLRRPRHACSAIPAPR
jgi:hypothetical protein